MGEHDLQGGDSRQQQGGKRRPPTLTSGTHFGVATSYPEDTFW
jgi:hypothetical protein